jgi:hypothetical protein
MPRPNSHRHSLMRIVLAPLIAYMCLACGVASSQTTVWLDGRVATIQALDKITARISTLSAPVGEARQFGTLEVTVQRCAFHPPEETPENAAFVVIRDLGYDTSVAPADVFSGWMFSSSPAISALEHPVYDITLLACSAD